MSAVTSVRNELLRGLIGLLVVVAAYIASLVICAIISGPGFRYLDAWGEVVTDIVIGLAICGLRGFLKFSVAALFATAVLVAVFVALLILCACVLAGGVKTINTGMLAGVWFVWGHTAFPALAGAALCFAVQRLRARSL